ncbi:MAG: nitrilase-related carbon-nitrogen hydrolase, partial [Clostridiaceae bacterium]
MEKNRVKISAIQSKTFMDLDDTLKYVEEKIDEAMKEKPDFIILPEMFSCPYRPDFFPVYAEEG